MPDPLWRLEMRGPADVLDPAADRLMNADPPLALSVTVFEDGPDKRLVELIFDRPPDTGAVRAAAGADLTVAILAEPLADADWVGLSLAGLKPVEAGRFRLRGSHDARRGGGVDIVIEAGEAFGTGHHGTTRGCLLMLSDLLRRFRPRASLDLGAGSGALAIGLALATRTPVAATDIDPVAVTATRANARTNGAREVTALHAAGLAHPWLRGAGFDLILANVLAGPLIALAQDLSTALAPGGRIILSGLLEPQERAVSAAYRARGLVLEKRLVLEGWSTLMMKRPE